MTLTEADNDLSLVFNNSFCLLALTIEPNQIFKLYLINAQQGELQPKH